MLKMTIIDVCIVALFKPGPELYRFVICYYNLYGNRRWNREGQDSYSKNGIIDESMKEI